MNPSIEDIDDPEIQAKLLELKQEQEEEIQKKIDLGEIIDFSSRNINDNGKAIKNKNQDINKNNDDNKKEKPRREITTFKYSEMGKGDLYESVFIDEGLPVFVKYNDKTNSFEEKKRIEETTRFLVPPAIEECPFRPYEFENLDEINRYNKFIEDNNVDLDYLYSKSFEIVSKYNNQAKHNLRIVSINLVSSYFQDRFSTTHYLYPVGVNGGGKTSLADTFKAGAYRAVTMTNPTAPNLFRLLGLVEPAQCVIILEEADKIDKSPELMAVLKTGYSYYGMVPKINPYTNKQEFFFTYCLKVIISERSLNQSIAKGVNSRTFPINCFKGVSSHDIKEVLNPTNTGGSENKKLFHEIIDFRKLLLVYRLRHFKDPIPDLYIGVEGRDKELVKHLIQLFYGCKCLKEEIIDTLQKFLDIKNEKKNSSIESVLLPIISTLVKHHGNEISSKLIWEEFINEIPGKLDEKKPNEYHTNDYGTIYRTTISNYLADSFGGIIKHKKTGNVLIFDREIIERLAKEDKTKIMIDNEAKQQELSSLYPSRGEEQQEDKGEGVKAVNTPDRGGSLRIEEEKIIDKAIQIDDNKHLVITKEGAKRVSSTSSNSSSIIYPPSSHALTLFTPSPSSADIIDTSQKLCFNNPLISESDLSIGGPYNPEIINNIDRFEGLDRWFCKNCKMKDDKWFMMKHQCNNNKKGVERTRK